MRAALPLYGALRGSERHLRGFRGFALPKSPISAPARTPGPLGRPSVEIIQVDGPSVAVLHGLKLSGSNGADDRGAALAGVFGGGIRGQSGHVPPSSGLNTHAIPCLAVHPASAFGRDCSRKCNLAALHFGPRRRTQATLAIMAILRLRRSVTPKSAVLGCLSGQERALKSRAGGGCWCKKLDLYFLPFTQPSNCYWRRKNL